MKATLARWHEGGTPSTASSSASSVPSPPPVITVDKRLALAEKTFYAVCGAEAGVPRREKGEGKKEYRGRLLHYFESRVEYTNSKNKFIEKFGAAAYDKYKVTPLDNEDPEAYLARLIKWINQKNESDTPGDLPAEESRVDRRKIPKLSNA